MDKVTIENPKYPNQAVTSLKRAKRFEKKGYAGFTGPFTIRLLDHPLVMAVAAKTAEQVVHERITGGQYDRIRRSFFRAARQIPIINPEKMLREERSSRKWSFEASVEKRFRREHTPLEVAAIRNAHGRA